MTGHVLVTMELIIKPVKEFGCDTVQGVASQLEKQYEEGTLDATDLIGMANSVTPIFEGVGNESNTRKTT